MNSSSSLVTAPSSGRVWHLHLHKAKIFSFTYFVTRYLYTCLLDLWGYLVKFSIPFAFKNDISRPKSKPLCFLTAQQVQPWRRWATAAAEDPTGGHSRSGWAHRTSRCNPKEESAPAWCWKVNHFESDTYLVPFLTTWDCGSWHTDAQQRTYRWKRGIRAPLTDAHRGPKVCWETRSLPRHCCWPWLDHLLKATSNRNIHVPSIWDMTVRSLCSGLRRHQILIQFGTFWDVMQREIRIKEAQPTNLQQLCDATVQHGPKCLKKRLKYATKKKSQFWRQKGSNPLLGRYA